METKIQPETILLELNAVFREVLGIEPAGPLTPDLRLFADLGLASIDAVVLGEALQSRFRRSLPFDRLLQEIGNRPHRDLSIGELEEFLRRSL
jgi:acyl carrier protein